MLSRKAQIGETTTWIVATLIIIAILIVSFFISSAAEIVGGKAVILPDKHKDFINEKSILNYFIENYDSVKDVMGNRDPIDFYMDSTYNIFGGSNEE